MAINMNTLNDEITELLSSIRSKLDTHNPQLYISISTSQFSRDNNFQIKHTVRIGGTYDTDGSEVTAESLYEAADRAVSRYLADREIAPVDRHLMIAATATEVGDADEVPF